MKKIIVGTMENGKRCVYDLPNEIKNVEQLNSLIYGYDINPAHREELQGQPLLLGLAGPMHNGIDHLKSTGEEVVIIRYEKPSK